MERQQTNQAEEWLSPRAKQERERQHQRRLFESAMRAVDDGLLTPEEAFAGLRHIEEDGDVE